jgi:hypothetical protein
LGPVNLFGAGAGAGFGGCGFDPSGVDALVEGITVPGLKFLENVEDF